jgi:Arc/MetJ family transcription regulator
MDTRSRLKYGTYMAHMRTTLIIDEDLLNRAKELTGIKEKTALVRAGLEALISREAGRRMAALGGTEPSLRTVHGWRIKSK